MGIEIPWLDVRKAVESAPVPLDFVLPGFKAGTVGALVSPGATGKTMLALELAVTVASGADLLDLASMDRQWQQIIGPVVFLTGEDPSDVLNGRFHSIGLQLSQEHLELIYSNLFVAPVAGFNADIMNGDWRVWIESVSKGARLVIIDTLRRFHHLDENDGSHMAGLLGYMEQLCRINGTSVLFLHHTSKAGASNGGDFQQASRGSSVLTDNARFQANLIAMGISEADKFGIDQELRRNFVRWSFPKLNYSSPIPDRWYQRHEGGVLKPAVLNLAAKTNGTLPFRRAKVGSRDEL